MNCSRCGAEAVVKRDAAFYCGKCAMARDWEEIIAVVQTDRLDVSSRVVDFESGPAPARPEAPAAVTTAPPPAPSGNGELPADPFG